MISWTQHWLFLGTLKTESLSVNILNRKTVSCQGITNFSSGSHQPSGKSFINVPSWLNLKGSGGGFDFHFVIVSSRGECQLSGTFIEMEKIVPNRSYCILKSRKYIQLHCAHKLKSRFPKINFKSIFSYSL